MSAERDWTDLIVRAFLGVWVFFGAWIAFDVLVHGGPLPSYGVGMCITALVGCVVASAALIGFVIRDLRRGWWT